jgi:hypothetical protein
MIQSAPPHVNGTAHDSAGQHIEESLRAGRECLEAGLKYNSLGLSVLPVCPPDHAGVHVFGHRKCTSPGKGPLILWAEKQTERASEAEIRSWWAKLPNSNVGIVLGPVSGLVRVDVDGEEGEKFLQEVSKGDLPDTWEMISGGGGRGLFYKIPDGAVFRTTSQSGEQVHQEFRLQGKGAQTVMPPSRHVSGKRYSWVEGHGPDDIDAADAPAWLVSMMSEENRHKNNGRAKNPPLDDAEIINDGRRDSTFTILAGHMRYAGMNEEEIFAGLMKVNERCEPNLPEDQVRKVAHSIAKHPPGDARKAAARMASAMAAWDDPIPLAELPPAPPFPVDALPGWMADFIKAEAVATQTPRDLTGMLSLAQAGATLAGKFRVRVRGKWTEPTNLFVTVALEVGERKSGVFKDVMAPTKAHQATSKEETLPIIAEAQAEHQTLENRKNHLSGKAAKEDDATARADLLRQVKEAAVELAQHKVPAEPQLICDDETPENLTRLLAKQGGRMFMAGPEGTAFEIAKGKYSESPNFDVFLKGHAGDDLHNGRVSRERDDVDDPALSIALAVQPDVIRGLAEHTTMRRRGFLARFLYAIPCSLVGNRAIAPHPVPDAVSLAFQNKIQAMWKAPSATDEETKKDVPHCLDFSPEADEALRAFETWLEPQLAPEEELAALAGWPNKLAGAIARIAGTLHVAKTIIVDAEGKIGGWKQPISRETAEAAIRLGRDYLLPHARIAFGIMGSEQRMADAKRVLSRLANSVNTVNCVNGGTASSKSGLANSVNTVNCVNGGTASPSLILLVSRRDIHAKILGSRYSTEEAGEVINLLVKHGYLRLHIEEAKAGAGRKSSPKYEIHPSVFAGEREYPRSHNSQYSQNREPGEDG